MKTIKKSISVILAAVMLLSVLTAAPFTVSAAGTNRTISVNTTYTDNLRSSSDVNKYKFTLSVPSKVSMNFRHEKLSSNTEYWNVKMYNSEDEELLEIRSDGNEAYSSTCNIGLSAGNYYVEVKAAMSYNNLDYKLTVASSQESNWETENNDRIINADNVKVNTIYNGSISNYNDQDCYKFVLSGQAKVSVNFRHPKFNDNFDFWTIEICNSMEETMLLFDSTGYDSNKTSQNIGLDSGVYYLKIRDGWCNSNLDYSFKVNVSYQSDWETECNNSISSADKISTEKYYNGNIQDYNDRDFYKFTLINDTSVYINFRHPKIDSTFDCWRIEICNSLEDTLLYFESKGVDNNCNSSKIKLRAGTYYLKITKGWIFDSTDYQFAIKTMNPTSVKLNLTSAKLGVGESYTLKSTVSPSNATTSYTWSSSNTKVATVKNGKLTAKAKGTTTITVKTSNGKTATCKLTVYPAPTSVKLSTVGVVIGVGEKFTISETVNKGAYACTPNLKWSTANAKVAAIAKGKSNTAVITGKKVGTTTVKITLYNGKTATCKVTVKAAPKSVKLNKTTITLKKGQKYTLTYGVNSGAYANPVNVKWSSNNTKGVTVAKGSANKCVVTAKNKGTATITVKTYNGKTAKCKVTVK